MGRKKGGAEAPPFESLREETCRQSPPYCAEPACSMTPQAMRLPASPAGSVS